MNYWRICHAFKIDRAKGGWCQWITLILYLHLMNICGTMAANLSGDSVKWGRKIILWWIKGKTGHLMFWPLLCLPDAMAFHGVLSLLNFQILRHLSKNSVVQQKLLILCGRAISWISWLFREKSVREMQFINGTKSSSLFGLLTAFCFLT